MVEPGAYCAKHIIRPFRRGKWPSMMMISGRFNSTREHRDPH
jgi:hypothetical protein